MLHGRNNQVKGSCHDSGPVFPFLYLLPLPPLFPLTLDGHPFL
jgi:hypothetical protein